MMASGATMFFFDFDIFSIEPIVDRLAGARQSAARRASPIRRSYLAGSTQSPFLVAIGLVADHALGEQAGERLVHADVAESCACARVKKRA